MNRLSIFLCCTLLSFSLWFDAAPAQAKWWQIFHRHKKDSTEQEQPPLSTPATGVSYSSNMTAPSASVPGNRNTAAGTSSVGVPAVQVQAVAPLLEPPSLPARPPIPSPPPVSCPAPLGSGVPKPTLAWRAKSVRQLSGATTNATQTLLATAQTAQVTGAARAIESVQATETGRTTETAQTTDSGLCLTKTFTARFDDTFMAAVLALSKSGFSIRSMDSMRGKLEALDPRLQALVSLQLNRDLLDTTSVSCCCTVPGTASKMLIANVLSNIPQYLRGSK